MKKFIKTYLYEIILCACGIFTDLLQCWLTLSVLAFVAYSPLFFALLSVRDRNRKKRFLLIYFLSCYLTQTAFILTVGRLTNFKFILGVILSFSTWIFISLWLTAVMYLSIFLYTKIKSKGLSQIILLSVFIVFGEWLQGAMPFFAFPFCNVWQSVIYSSSLTQCASLFGGLFLSFIILLINGLFTLTFKAISKPAKAIHIMSAIVLILSAVKIFGDYKLDTLPQKYGDKISVIICQGDSQGSDKKKSTSTQQWEKYKQLIEKYSSNAQLCLLPETAIPKSFCSDDEIFSDVSQTAINQNINIITGCFYKNNDKQYNAMCVFDPNGEQNDTAYLKSVLVPAWL